VGGSLSPIQQTDMNMKCRHCTLMITEHSFFLSNLSKSGELGFGQAPRSGFASLKLAENTSSVPNQRSSSISIIPEYFDAAEKSM
jgi:hypothetical protein